MRVALANPALKHTVAWGPASLYMLLIWYLSSHPVELPMMGAMPMGDKGIHFVEYGVLALLLAHAMQMSWPTRPLRYMAAGWLTLLFGLSDELHQAFVPGRSAEIPDLIADALGALMGLVLYAALRKAAQLLLSRTRNELRE